MKVAAYRHTDDDGKSMDLVYDTDDVESFETPIDVHVVEPHPGDKGFCRELGQAHLLLHFREGARTTWVPVDEVTE